MEDQKLDRTWLCSVVFMDIVSYSKQSVQLQMRWKERFNKYLAEAIRDVPEIDRVILDTGDGAALCFLGDPEAAMFSALKLRTAFLHDVIEQQPGLLVRIGINLGPVKLVRDINGNLNAIGDGINVAQRVMNFASENQVLVSRSYYEVVGCLSDSYNKLIRASSAVNIRTCVVRRPGPEARSIGSRENRILDGWLPRTYGASPHPDSCGPCGQPRRALQRVGQPHPLHGGSQG